MYSNTHQSQIAGFLPPLASANEVCRIFSILISLIRLSQALSNMNIPESALTEFWPIQVNDDPPRVSIQP